jgi:hypothetical protein
MSFRSLSCVFLGYSKPHIGYKCLHIPTGRLYIARHVVFNENKFPFQSHPVSMSPSCPTSTTLPSSLRLPTTLPIMTSQPSSSPASTHVPSSPSTASVTVQSDSPHVHNSPSQSLVSSPLAPSPSPLPPARCHQMVTRAQNNIHKPKRYTDGSVRYPLPHAYTTSLICDEVEPTSYT